MAVAVKNTKKKKGARRRGHFPTKRTINLAGLGEKPLRLSLAIPSIILILLVAAAFSKFLVIDRLMAVSAAQAEVGRLHAKLNEGYAELDDLDDLTNLHAHYTYTGFTSEELNRADRAETVKLLRTTVVPYARISNWAITGNQLTINLSAESLQQVNLIAQQLMEQEIVEYCMVHTANAKDVSTKSATTVTNTNKTPGANTNAKITNEIVTARIQVNLKGGSGVK